MVKKLRFTFIAVTMLAVLFVLTAIIGGINVASYQNVNAKKEEILDLLEKNDGLGIRPENVRPHGPISGETPYSVRYFTIYVSEDHSVEGWNTVAIARPINAETATAFIAATSYKNSGYLPGTDYAFRYITTSTGQGAYVFLDRGEDLTNFRVFLAYSTLFSAIGLVGVFLLVFFLSALVFKPIEQAYEKQRHFITDAGHELKTPLTVISANCEVLELETGENEWIDSIKNQTARLSQLTKNLVYLSKLDEGEKPLVLVDFSLSDAVEESANPYFTVAKTKGMELKLSIAPALSYHGDETAIREVVGLLLDNAVKYSTGKEIFLGLEKSGKNFLLTVKNEAEGLSCGKQDMLFERFYRPDPSRSKGTGGHGIGLSVVKAIAEAHGGKAAATSDGKSITFTITL